MIKVKPYRGRFMTRNKANKINDALFSAKVPDRTELKKEAEEFINFIKKQRAIKNDKFE